MKGLDSVLRYAYYKSRSSLSISDFFIDELDIIIEDNPESDPLYQGFKRIFVSEYGEFVQYSERMGYYGSEGLILDFFLPLSEDSDDEDVSPRNITFSEECEDIQPWNKKAQNKGYLLPSFIMKRLNNFDFIEDQIYFIIGVNAGLSSIDFFHKSLQEKGFDVNAFFDDPSIYTLDVVLLHWLDKQSYTDNSLLRSLNNFKKANAIKEFFQSFAYRGFRDYFLLDGKSSEIVPKRKYLSGRAFAQKSSQRMNID
jgi:hypothetical protein